MHISIFKLHANWIYFVNVRRYERVVYTTPQYRYRFVVQRPASNATTHWVPLMTRAYIIKLYNLTKYGWRTILVCCTSCMYWHYIICIRCDALCALGLCKWKFSTKRTSDYGGDLILCTTRLLIFYYCLH